MQITSCRSSRVAVLTALVACSWLSTDGLMASTSQLRDRNPTDVQTKGGGLGGAVFSFTGATTATTIATTVHCSNTGPTAVTVTVQLFDFDASPTAIASGIIQGGRTRTTSFSSGNAANSGTAIYAEDEYIDTAADDIRQGRGMISANPVNAPIICTAQVLESDSVSPSFITKLPLTRLNGAAIAPDVFSDGFES